MVLHPDDHGPVERRVGLSVPPRLSRCRVVIPEDAGMGATPQSLAKAAAARPVASLR